MTSWDEIIRQVRHPGRYLGCEINAVSKNPSDLTCRFALAYPDLYELGMSYLGLQVLYRLLNDHADIWAERVFAPDIDLESLLRKENIPLVSLESRTPLSEFDVLGFTLQHELNYPDVLVMLELGGIPLRSAERSVTDPLVIAGGPCVGNPEPLAEALDAVYLGDAEAGLPDVARKIGSLRSAGSSRDDILDALQSIEGIYVPSRYRITYRSNGDLQSIEESAGTPKRTRRVWLEDLDSHKSPTEQIVPTVQTIHDRLTLEIQRGCTRGCRFCQAGMINRPVRQRSIETISEAIESGLAATGHEQVSFLSLSAGDHPQILSILENFYQCHAADRISASLPSLRADTLTSRLADLVKTVRKSGFTIAPEAGSERLRKLINKDLSDSDVISAAVDAFNAGWRLLKLYFMVGLPTERDEDLDQIVDMVSRVRKELLSAGHRPRINVGISTFVPKAHTPFQWEPMLDRERADHANQYVRRGLKTIRGIKSSWTRPELSWVEGVLSRGDRRLFEALVTIAKSGARLAGWSEHFDMQEFERAFEGLSNSGGADFYLRERSLNELLPWAHLDMGPDFDFLSSERQKAFAGETTFDCVDSECGDCGACLSNQSPSIAASREDTRNDESNPAIVIPGNIPGASPDPEANPRHRIRLKISKEGPAAFLSHLEFMKAVIRALRRSGWPLTYSAGFHPKVKISFGPACPVGAESRTEMMDIFLMPPFELETLKRKLEEQLAEGMTLLDIQEIPLSSTGIIPALKSIRYKIQLDSQSDMAKAAEDANTMMTSDSWWITREVKHKLKRVDLRPSLLNLEIETQAGGAFAILDLQIIAGAVARPSEIAREVFGLEHPRILREQFVFKNSQESQP